MAIWNEAWRRSRVQRRSFDKWLHTHVGGEAAVGAGFLAAIAVGVLWAAKTRFSDLGTFLDGVIVESAGFVLDVAFFGVILVLLRRRWEREDRTQRYLEELQDFATWQSEEGARRNRGLVVRLAELGKQKNLPTSLYLSGTNLSGVNLSAARFWNANLSKASLIDARLIGTDFSGANLIDANLATADLSKAKFDQVDLHGADLRAAKLRGADLSGTNLYDAKLRGADLSGAFLDGANLGRANLVGAIFDGADLDCANLSEADVNGADLRGAKNLTCDQLVQTLNWHGAYRDEELACGAPIPEKPDED